ncbi:helix-turn-helix domain-containing protein [Rufibacter psychrotolerans]|uniref:helix-turn-helix domain-containing protein n=1 Tax=Rufibacter psychrotolerans TaxID=2812556 RepID=UPI001967EE3E|nr:helix-turn-helix domain-containing protein [Rufibacter sp. SYSU D00308]
MEFILTTPDQLKTVITDAIFRALNEKPVPQQLPDRCTFDDAIEITGLSKSKLYKLTSAKEIPHKRFGSRLIFSRKELVAWIDSQTIEQDRGGIDLALARSARKKKGACHA